MRHGNNARRTPRREHAPRGAATPRALAIGAVGSAVLTASSMYVALKLGALPWPIVFAALASVLVLRLMGSRNLHEANVAHAAMSAGAMIAGGLAFTVPGIWMLDAGAQVPFAQVLAASVGGTALGLVVTAVMRPYFIERENLPYPVGASAAQTLVASQDARGGSGGRLFASMGLAGVYAFARDGLHLLPSVLLSDSTALPGIALGINNSPMSMAVGFIVGPAAAGVWFVGALVGALGIHGALVGSGLIDLAGAEALRSSLGLGLMLGSGAGVVALNLVPLARRALAARRARAAVAAGTGEKGADTDADTGVGTGASGSAGAGTGASAARDASTGAGADGASGADAESGRRTTLLPLPWAGLACAAVACLAAFALGLGLVPSVILVVGSWLAMFLSAYLTGSAGVNPMEVFGVLLLVLVQTLFHELETVSLFLLAAVCAVACGVVGDVMNDFRAGAALGTDDRDQMFGMAVGAAVGSVVAAAVLFGLVQAYGTDAFGAGKEFVAAQASVVATMAGGIPHVPGFAAGVAVGAVLALLRLPVMTLGLGVYLPFYISAATACGAALRFAFERLQARKANGASDAARTLAVASASGVLGGESLVGVGIALATMLGALLA